MKPKPIRIQRSRQHKQVSPNGLPIVYVGRPSKWGNPFKVGESPNMEGITNSSTFFEKYYLKALTLRECLIFYKRWLRYVVNYTKRYGGFPHGDQETIYNLTELKGKNLSCWCKLCDKHKNGKPLDEYCPDCKPCHCDPLGKLANE